MTPVLAFLARRVAATVGVLGVVAVLVFLLLRLVPGDPAAIIAGDSATTEQIEQIREGLGLNRPLAVQFGIWFANVVRGDLGESFVFKKTVSALIAQRLEPTIALALCTIVLAVMVAVPLGVLAAWRHGGWLDRALMGFSTLGFSIPVFVLGYLLIWLVSLKLGWLPVQGYRRLSSGFYPFIQHLILPSITLSVVYIALDCAADPGGRVAGAHGRLRPHRQSQGPARTARARPACAGQRRGADRHGDRHRTGDVDGGRRGDRKRLRHTGFGPADGGRRAGERLPDHPGRRARCSRSPTS